MEDFVVFVDNIFPFRLLLDTIFKHFPQVVQLFLFDLSKDLFAAMAEWTL